MNTNKAYLTIKIPEELIDKYRYADVEYCDWHDYIVEQFIEDHLPEARGIAYNLDLNPHSKSKLEFDIYHGQCYFPIIVCDWKHFLEHEGLEDKYPTVLRYHAWGAGNNLVFSTENRSNRYGFSLEYDEGYVGFDWNDALDEFTQETLNIWLRAEIADLLDYVEDLCKELYQQLLGELAAAYDDYTSDSTVAANIPHYLDNDELEQWCLEHQGNIVWTSKPLGAPQ